MRRGPVCLFEPAAFQVNLDHGKFPPSPFKPFPSIQTISFSFPQIVSWKMFDEIIQTCHPLISARHHVVSSRRCVDVKRYVYDCIYKRAVAGTLTAAPYRARMVTSTSLQLVKLARFSHASRWQSLPRWMEDKSRRLKLPWIGMRADRYWKSFYLIDPLLFRGNTFSFTSRPILVH